MPRTKFAPLLLLGLVACAGGGTTTPDVTSPFTEEDALLFEDRIDFVGEPNLLEGQWLVDWQNELDGRVQRADGIYIVSIDTVREDVDLDRRSTYRLYGTVEQVVLGSERELIEMTVTEGEGGFAIVRNNVPRIQRHLFVSFVKWYEDEIGQVRAHWHMAPAEPQVLTALNSAVRELR